jgi:dienelactone hydrolase
MTNVPRLIWLVRIVIGLLLSVTIKGALAQTVGFVPIETTTVNTRQFLTGGRDGKTAMIAGELRIPKPPPEKVAAVIIMEGGGGITELLAKWAETINGMGIASLVVDSYSGRGIDSSKLDNMAQMVDAYRALGVLAAHPRIDPKRIAILGISRGAVAAVYSSNVRFRDIYAPGGVEFAAHIGLYATCNTAYRGDNKVTGKPIRLFHGVADDLASVDACRDYVARLSKSGADVELTEYPGAYHSYDAFAIKEPLKVPQALSTRNCRRVEDDNGLILNSATGKPFDMGDACVEKGMTFAYNEAAATATIAAVKAFLSGALK